MILINISRSLLFIGVFAKWLIIFLYEYIFLLINIELKEHQQKGTEKKLKQCQCHLSYLHRLYIFIQKLFSSFFPFILYSKTPPIVIRTFLSLVSKAKNDGSALWVSIKMCQQKLDITKINCWKNLTFLVSPPLRRWKKEEEKEGKNEKKIKKRKIDPKA